MKGKESRKKMRRMKRRKMEKRRKEVELVGGKK